MAALRGDQYVKLPSPSKALGMQRNGVSQSVPQGQDRKQVSHHQARAAAIVLLPRATGMRLRDAILADLPRLSREANDLVRCFRNTTLDCIAAALRKGLYYRRGRTTQARVLIERNSLWLNG